MIRVVCLLATMLYAVSALGAEAIRHRFLVVDNGKNRLVYVDQTDPAKGWSVAIPAGSRDLQLVGADCVLVSHGTGAAEYNLATGAKGWTVDRYKGVTTAQRLPNGHTLLGADGLAIYEVDADGKEVGMRTVPALKDQRLLRSLENGNLLIGLAGPHKLVEVDPAGATVRDITLPGKGYLGLRLPNGHTLASTGEACSVVEIDTEGKTVATWGGKAAHPAARLLWFSGFQQLASGNLVVANWCGHGQAGKGPHVVEFAPDNTLVWQWEDHTAAATVTNVLVVE